MYKTATKQQYRYNTSKGLVTTEDLWVIPLTNSTNFNLDAIAISIAKELESLNTKSFVNPTSSTGKVKLLQAKLAIVKDIITDKLAEQEAKKQAQFKAERKQKILEILASKEDKALKKKSQKELLKELEELE